MTFRMAGLLLAVAVAMLVVYWATEATDQTLVPASVRRVPVQVCPVAQQLISEQTEAIGTARARESVALSPTVTDVIEQIHFTDGEFVEAGTVLVNLAMKQELASVAEAEALVAEQQREVARIEALVRIKSLPQNQLDERRTQLEVARQRLAAAKASVRDRVISAPFSGVLGLRNVSLGALVTPQTVITTLDDIDTILLDFPVAEVFLSSLRLGLEVVATTPAFPKRTFTGLVRGIDSRVNPVDRSLMVRAELPNSERLLKPGMLLNVELLHGMHRAMMIPEESVLQRQQNHYVFKVEGPAGDLRVREQPIVVGTRKPGYVEVVSGLEINDRVVFRGIMSLRHGQPITIRAERERPE